MSCRRQSLILGMPWLKEFNPSVDWKHQTINIPDNTDQTAFLDHELREAIGPSPTKSTYPDLLPSDFEEADIEEPFFPDENFVRYISRNSTPITTNRFIKVGGRMIPSVAKTSISTQLESSTINEEITLPAKYQEFALVFSEEASHVLPPGRPYDHAINLEKTFIPKVGKVYPLSPEEQKATEDFLEENLKSGKICPSKSPQVSLSSLWERKTVAFIPAKTITMSTVKP